MRLRAGSVAAPFRVESTEGTPLSLDALQGRPVLLMFFRYASCPMCNLRVHDFAREYPALHARGLEAIAFFHSSARRVRNAAGRRHPPFPLVGDPGEAVYRAYGVERSWPRLLLSVARPGFYVDWVRSMRHGFWGGADLQMATMPADFLIGRDGRIAVAHYGRDIGDHLPTEAIAGFLDGQA